MVDSLDKIVSLCKRRGFIFPSSEIYGGLSAVYDYGPLGVELKNNIKKLWWQDIVYKRDNVVGLDAAIFMNKKVWEASGHTTLFTEEFEGRPFNLMFETYHREKQKKNLIYLRPETAQGVFVNYLNILDTQRAKLPFGIAQIGKSFRNEVTPEHFLIKILEFEQMELEYFVSESEAEKCYNFWRNERLNWYLNLGIKKENLRLKEHSNDELAHYAKACTDVEYRFPFGWKEIEGIANRGDYDLRQHQKFSGQNFPQPLPYIVESSSGIDRIFLALLCDAYCEVRGGRTKTTKPTKEIEVVLRLNPKLSPVKVAVLPLIKKPQLIKIAKQIKTRLSENFLVQYDEKDSIGRRYRRQDEIGTPICITVDFESIENQDVTLRDRDSMNQIRVKINRLAEIIPQILAGQKIEKFGKIIK